MNIYIFNAFFVFFWKTDAVYYCFVKICKLSLKFNFLIYQKINKNKIIQCYLHKTEEYK